MREIRGKTALITGAASGLGRALALRLAREGAQLFLLDVDEAGLAGVVTEAKQYGVNAHAHFCDLTSARQIARATAEVNNVYGGVDILVNNAGVCFYGLTTEMSDEQFDQLHSINLLAPVRLTRDLLPSMLKRPEAHILNVSSMYGFLTTNRCSAYHLSKFGLLGFTQSLRNEYSRHGLGVTALCPGFIDTNLFTSMKNKSRKKEVRIPPRWISTTPDRVAAKAIRGIYRNQRMVLVTPIAYLSYFATRFVPGLLDWFFRVGGRRIAASATEAGSTPLQAHVADESSDRQHTEAA